MRRIIASRLTESKAKVPHYTASIDCRLDALMGVRTALKAAGIKVSVNSFVVRYALAATGAYTYTHAQHQR